MINIAKLPWKRTQGYTIIELLVTLSILGILFAAGFANYRDFSRRQALQSAVKSVEADLKIAQQAALSSRSSSDSFCASPNYLSGYFFNVKNSTSYEIKASCSGGSVSSVIKDVALPNGISIASPFPIPNPILFKVLGSGTNIPNGSSATLILRQGTTNIVGGVDISSSGQIQLNTTVTPGPTTSSAPTTAPTATASPLPTTPPTTAPTLSPSPSPSGCTTLNFVSGNTSPSTVSPGGSFAILCNYNAVSNGIAYSANGGTCNFSFWSGTTANFSCTATTTPGTYANRCRVITPNDGNYCSRIDTIPSLIVSTTASTPTPTPSPTPSPSPTPIPTPSPTPSCIPLTFLGGSASPTSVARGGAYTVTCNYGVSGTTALSVVVNSGSCGWGGWNGTIGTWNCTAGTTTGTFANRCRVLTPNSENYCSSLNNINSITVY